MTGYKIVNLKLMVDELGEVCVKKILSEFSCPKNPDVENFLKIKAIEFAKQGLAGTHVVFAQHREKVRIVGYFSLANKIITVNPKVLSYRMRRRLNRFGRYDENLKVTCIATPLIAQIGKNFSDGLDKLIRGDELLEMACNILRGIQLDMGGGFVYLECEDKRELKDFYEKNGFFEFDKRELDKDETDLSGEYLLQMMRYLGNT